MTSLLFSAMAALAAAAAPGTQVPAPPDAGPGAAHLPAALQDARSAEAPRHQQLLAQLQTQAYLETLDRPTDYAEAASQGLHVGQILDALARNPAPSAQRVLRSLTGSKTFLAHDERVIALIRASASVKPASSVWVRFWDRHSRPDDGFTPTTIGALVDNGSDPALRLLEKKLADPGHRDDDKRAWMHREILRHRNDPALLQASARLLKGRLPSRLRPALVEVLFDYRPGEWFKPGYGVSAPPLASASAAARVELRKLGTLALRSVALSASQRAGVRRPAPRGRRSAGDPSPVTPETVDGWNKSGLLALSVPAVARSLRTRSGSLEVVFLGQPRSRLRDIRGAEWIGRTSAASSPRRRYPTVR